MVLRASRELRLDGATLSADIRGGKAAKVHGGSLDVSTVGESCLVGVGADDGVWRSWKWLFTLATMMMA